MFWCARWGTEFKWIVKFVKQDKHFGVPGGTLYFIINEIIL